MERGCFHFGVGAEKGSRRVGIRRAELGGVDAPVRTAPLPLTPTKTYNPPCQLRPEEEAHCEAHLQRADPTFSRAASAAVGPQSPNLEGPEKFAGSGAGPGGVRGEG